MEPIRRVSNSKPRDSTPPATGIPVTDAIMLDVGEIQDGVEATGPTAPGGRNGTSFLAETTNGRARDLAARASTANNDKFAASSGQNKKNESDPQSTLKSPRIQRPKHKAADKKGRSELVSANKLLSEEPPAMYRFGGEIVTLGPRGTIPSYQALHRCEEKGNAGHFKKTAKILSGPPNVLPSQTPFEGTGQPAPVTTGLVAQSTAANADKNSAAYQSAAKLIWRSDAVPTHTHPDSCQPSAERVKAKNATGMEDNNRRHTVPGTSHQGSTAKNPVPNKFRSVAPAETQLAVAKEEARTIAPRQSDPQASHYSYHPQVNPLAASPGHYTHFQQTPPQPNAANVPLAGHSFDNTVYPQQHYHYPMQIVPTPHELRDRIGARRYSVTGLATEPYYPYRGSWNQHHQSAHHTAYQHHNPSYAQYQDASQVGTHTGLGYRIASNVATPGRTGNDYPMSAKHGFPTENPHAAAIAIAGAQESILKETELPKGSNKNVEKAKRRRAPKVGRDGESRYWTEAEHLRYIEAMRTLAGKHAENSEDIIGFKCDFPVIAARVGTRTTAQCRTHHQKWVKRMVRQTQNLVAQHKDSEMFHKNLSKEEMRHLLGRDSANSSNPDEKPNDAEGPMSATPSDGKEAPRPKLQKPKEKTAVPEAWGLALLAEVASEVHSYLPQP